jgi:aarF domain-containing kinase
MIKRIAGATLSATVGGGAYAYYWARTNMGTDAVDRIFEYDKVAVPMIMDYKWLEFKLEKAPYFSILSSFYPLLTEEEQKKQFQVLHDKHAKPLFDCFMQLGGFYYKSGQKIAANAAGVVPETYINMFQPFLNNIPARSMDDIRSVIEHELGDGKKMEDVFDQFDPIPIGTASIGQVHRAFLKSNGQRVVVKVQNPRAEATFRGDVFALKVVIDSFFPQFSLIFREIERQFATEFDYRGECKNQMEVKNNLAKTNFNVIVPDVIQELCSEKIMVMEEIYPSVPLHDQLNNQAELMAKQRGLTKTEFIEIEKKKISSSVAELAKQRKVPVSITESQYDQYIALQQSKRAGYRTLKHVYNWTLGWFTGSYDIPNNVDDEDILVPLNAARLINELFAVHGHECLIDGCFNADPHPGNILCVDGKLALIDYGQVKRMTDQQRYEAAKIVLLVDAAIKRDPRQNPHVHPEVHSRAKAALVKFSKKTGFNTKHNYDDTLYEMCTVYYGRMDHAWVYPLNIIQWTDKIQNEDPMGAFPESLDYAIMVNMTSMMLRGLGEYLQQYRNVAECWAPYARQALAETPGALEAVEAEIAAFDVIDSLSR